MKLKIKESLLIKRDRPDLNKNIYSTPLYLFWLYRRIILLSDYMLAIYKFLIIHPKRNLLVIKSVIEVLNSIYFRIVFCKVYMFMYFISFLVDAFRYLFINYLHDNGTGVDITYVYYTVQL